MREPMFARACLAESRSRRFRQVRGTPEGFETPSVLRTNYFTPIASGDLSSFDRSIDQAINGGRIRIIRARGNETFVRVATALHSHAVHAEKTGRVSHRLLPSSPADFAARSGERIAQQVTRFIDGRETISGRSRASTVSVLTKTSSRDSPPNSD